MRSLYLKTFEKLIFLGFGRRNNLRKNWVTISNEL